MLCLLSLNMWSYWHGARVAVYNAAPVKSSPRTPLAQVDAVNGLAHLDPQVKTQGTEITHFEEVLHLLLEVLGLPDVEANDDIDANKQMRLSTAANLEGVLAGAPLETE